ncbi:MAG: dehydrogenase [Phycisphaerae bacterium]
MTRRRFSAGMVAAGAAVSTVRRSARAALGANERIRLGIIGTGNRGDQLLDAFKSQPDAQIAALCDVYAPYLDFAREKAGGEPFIAKDYRDLLDRRDLDAVVIATPDHWHALQFVDACAAGKDIYVEKPLSLVVTEGRTMVDAARRHRRITQMGVQRRSAPICQKAVQLIREGAIGQVTVVRCFHLANEFPMGMGAASDGPPPEGLHWDMWLGPAPRVAFNRNRCLYKFRWFRDYSGGQMTNFGTHYIDMIQWALGADAPLGVFSAGGRYAVEDNREVPDTAETVWEYPGGTLVIFSQYNANGASATAQPAEIEFRGTKGTLYYSGGKITVVPQEVRIEPMPASNPLDRKEAARQWNARKRTGEPYTESGRVGESDHARNFLDCIKSRKPCNCPVEAGHKSTTATLLANIALDRRRYIAWDAQREQITNDPEANKLLTYEYRAPWKLTI